MPLPPASALAALADLERFFNGPIPAPARELALLGSPVRAARIRAAAEAAFFSAMVRGQLLAIRRRRVEGSFYPALLADLALYRRHRREWRRLAGLSREAPPARGGASG